MTDPAQSFVNTLQGKQQQVRTQKQAVLPKVAAAKQAIFNFAPKIIPSYSNVTVPSYDDVVAPTYDHIYTEETSPLTLPSVINQEGNIREHTDGTFSVIEDDGFIQPFKDEQTARTYRAYTTAKDEAKRQGAPEPGSAGDVANRLLQGTANIFGMGYTGAVGTGQTLRHQIDDYNSRGPWKTPVVQLGRKDQGTKWYKITEEDEYKFNNIDQLNPNEQSLYKQSLKYRILTELKNRAEETKENLVVAEERVETVLEKIPVNRAEEAARSADFKYVAETEGLWEATKYTLREDWTSYLYGGIDAIPYMAVLATGNVPAITTLVSSMAIGNNVENTKEFLRLNDGREPTQDEAARIQLFSVTQAVVDAIGDRLAVAGLPKAVRAALSAQLISAKKILASTAKSVPSVLKSSAAKTVAKIITTPVKMVVTEAPAGAFEDISRQIATEGKISDPAAIVEAAIIEGFAAPVAGPVVRVGAAVGKAVTKKAKSKKEEEDKPIDGTFTDEEGVKWRPLNQETDDSDTVSLEEDPDAPPTYGEDGADLEFYTLIDSVKGKNTEEDIKTLLKVGKGVLTTKQKQVHLDKIAELEKKTKDAADNTNPTEDESLGSIGNFDDPTQVDIDRLNRELTELSGSDQENTKKVVEILSNLQGKRERAKANTSDVSKDIREGTGERFRGADTFFSKIEGLVKEMVSAPDPSLKEREILTEENRLQIHAGNLEKKEEAFKKARGYVVDKSKKIPESTELDTNEAIVDENGVKPRVGTGDTGSAIVIGVTEGGAGTGTTYTVYYNQSKAEIKDAKAKHPGFVTKVLLIESGPNKGKSTINRLTEEVIADSDYVNSVATSATTYLKSELYEKALNKVKQLRSDQIEIAEIREQAEKQDTAVVEATVDEIDAIDQEKGRTGTINVFWGKDESNESTKILSNLAPRTFIYQEREYGSVEHAYQSNKSGTFDQAIYDKYLEIKGFGRKIQGEASTKQLKSANSLGLMKELVVESFIQNPDSDAAAKLMQYAEFTHDNDGLIDQAFLDGLYLAQENLDKSVQDAADAKEVDEAGQTTPIEETSPEEAATTPEKDGVYVGDLKDGVRNGQGIYTFPDGAKYVGEWKNGKQDGQGAHTESDGSEYVGGFKDGVFHGKGIFTTPDGEILKGTFEKGGAYNITAYNKDGSILFVMSEGKKTSPKTQAEETPPAEGADTATPPTATTETASNVADTDTADTTTEAKPKAKTGKQIELELARKSAEEAAAKAERLRLEAQQSSKIRTISYNLKGQATQTYTVEGSKIFNKKNEEVFKEDSPHRNKIFANLAVKEGRAQVVEHDKKKYVVNDKQQIMSVATGQIMRWAENHGTRKAILEQIQPAQESVQESSEVSFKLDNNLSLQESELDVHTLSVLFPAAINADGTLRTGDTADKAINKLGKFLEVCK